MKTVQQMLQARTAKYAAHTQAYAYYDSTQTPRYMSRRVRDYFRENPHYIENWMAIVANAVIAKLIIDSVTVTDNDEKATALGELWRDQQMDSVADEIHENLVITGEAFLIVERDLQTNKVQSFSQDPRAVVVFYGSDNPLKITEAAKFYVEDGYKWLIHYTDTVFYIYQGPQILDGESPLAGGHENYRLVEETANPYGGMIPVFHFRRSRRVIRPEFYQVTPLQDTINKMFVSLGMSAEFAAQKLRWAITNADVSNMQPGLPGDVIALPPSDTGEQPVSVGEWSAADLRQFVETISSKVASIASITSTPLHYFGTYAGASISGEALQALESPLVAKCDRYSRILAPIWAAASAFMLTLSGKPTTVSEITVVYKDPRTTLTISQAMSRKINVDAGMPLITQLRDEGWTASELEQLIADRLAETPALQEAEQLEKAYDVLAARNAKLIEPMLGTALKAIRDAAIAEMAKPENIERLSRAIARPE